MNTNRLHKATQWWTTQGITIGWCDGKAPTPMPHGHKGYTDNLDRLWKYYKPGYNLGGRPAEHHLVLDIDPRNGGFDTMTKLGLTTPRGTMVIRTGSGGLHIWYHKPPNQKVRGQLGPGIDIKTHTGQIILPPSIHPETGNEYTFHTVHNLNALPQLPNHLKQRAYITPQDCRQVGSKPFSPEHSNKRLQGMAHSIANAPKGTRSTTAYARTIYALEQGLDCIDLFTQAAEASGLTPTEARKAINAAVRKHGGK